MEDGAQFGEARLVSVELSLVFPGRGLAVQKLDPILDLVLVSFY